MNLRCCAVVDACDDRLDDRARRGSLSNDFSAVRVNVGSELVVDALVRDADGSGRQSQCLPSGAMAPQP